MELSECLLVGAGSGQAEEEEGTPRRCWPGGVHGQPHPGSGQGLPVPITPAPPNPLPVPALHPVCLGHRLCIAFTSPPTQHMWGPRPQAVSSLGQALNKRDCCPPLPVPVPHRPAACPPTRGGGLAALTQYRCNKLFIGVFEGRSALELGPAAGFGLLRAGNEVRRVLVRVRGSLRAEERGQGWGQPGWGMVCLQPCMGVSGDQGELGSVVG